MCTTRDAPDARSPNAQLRVWDPTAPLIEQGFPAGCDAIDQLSPLIPGNASVSVTAFAVPGPEFETPIVNPTVSPALTVAASAVFVMWSDGHWTVVEAEAVTSAWLVAEAVAVLG